MSPALPPRVHHGTSHVRGPPRPIEHRIRLANPSAGARRDRPDVAVTESDASPFLSDPASARSPRTPPRNTVQYRESSPTSTGYPLRQGCCDGLRGVASAQTAATLGVRATWRRLGVLSQGRSQKDAAVVGALLLGQRRSHPRGDELTAATSVEQSDRSPMTIAWRAPALLVGRVSRCRRPQTRLGGKRASRARSPSSSSASPSWRSPWRRFSRPTLRAATPTRFVLILPRGCQAVCCARAACAVRQPWLEPSDRRGGHFRDAPAVEGGEGAASAGET